MRLNRFNPNSIDVGTTGGGGRFPGGGGGKVGCGTIVIAMIAYFVFGADPMQTIGAISGADSTQQVEQQAGNQTEEAVCTSNQYALETCNALSSLNETWQPIFARSNVRFQQPKLRFATSDRFRSGCGAAASGMGPFYCPADEGIYIDTRFYDTMARELGARGDFARL